MSYLKHNKFKEAKNLELVKVQAEQFANKFNQNQSVIEKNNPVYGKYYEFIPEEKAKAGGYRILFTGKKLPIASVQGSDKPKRPKSAGVKGKTNTKPVTGSME